MKRKFSDEERRARRLACQRRYSAANREKLNKKSKEYRDSNPQKRWDIMLRHRYGIAALDYDALLMAQGSACAICYSREAGGGKSRLHVDHCHATGTVRGLLCHRCNTALGLLRDSQELLCNTIAYLNLSA